MIKYDKVAAREKDIDWIGTVNTSDMINFSSSIFNGKICRLATLIMYVPEHGEVTKAEINSKALNNNKKTSYGAYYSWASTNKVLSYSSKTKKWSRGENYNRYISDINACITIESKLNLLGL